MRTVRRREYPNEPAFIAFRSLQIGNQIVSAIICSIAPAAPGKVGVIWMCVICSFHLLEEWVVREQGWEVVSISEARTADASAHSYVLININLQNQLSEHIFHSSVCSNLSLVNLFLDSGTKSIVGIIK